MIWLRAVLGFLVLAGAAFGAAAALGARREAPRPRGLAARVRGILPGWDCGACGREDCDGFAAHLAEGGARPSACGPLDRESRERIASMLGPASGPSGLAVVACAGDRSVARLRFPYVGSADCRAAAAFYGGPRGCASACLGYGDCLPSCPIGAIHLEDGLARVDHERCDGCGECVSACPNGVIRLVAGPGSWYVACNSRERPAAKAKACDTSCTACRACERLSGNGEFAVVENLAMANQVSTGTHDLIAEACPTGVIRAAGIRPRAAGDKSRARTTGMPGPGL